MVGRAVPDELPGWDMSGCMGGNHSSFFCWWVSGGSGPLGRCANRPSIRVWQLLGGARADARGMWADARGVWADARGASACRRRCVIGKAAGDPAEAKGGGTIRSLRLTLMDLAPFALGDGPLSQFSGTVCFAATSN
jgi:hypothetical protein